MSRRAFLAAILFSCIGIVFLTVNAWRASRHASVALSVPLRVEAGETARGEFVADTGAFHEVELEFEWSQPSEELKDMIFALDETSALQVQWSIRADGELVAAGDSREYLYVTLEKGFKRQLHDRVLGYSSQNPWVKTVARGVGRFDVVAGRRYEVGASVDANSGVVLAVRAQLVVRPNRQFSKRHYDKNIGYAYVGLMLFGIAGLAVLGSVAARLAQRLKHTRALHE